MIRFLRTKPIHCYFEGFVLQFNVIFYVGKELERENTFKECFCRKCLYGRSGKKECIAGE